MQATGIIYDDGNQMSSDGVANQQVPVVNSDKSVSSNAQPVGSAKDPSK